MIRAVHLRTFNYWHILAVVLYEIATSTLSLTDKTAAMVVVGILRQAPDSSRLPVDLRLIVLNQGVPHLAICPGMTGVCFTTVCLESAERL